jgi:hypothetical protein
LVDVTDEGRGTPSEVIKVEGAGRAAATSAPIFVEAGFRGMLRYTEVGSE